MADYEGPRYLRVPWISLVSESMDLRRGGTPAVTIRTGSHGRVVACQVPGESAMLALKLEHGWPVAAAPFVSEIPIEPAQSNPRRREDEDAA